ncbi:hypothetical protein [Pedobacter psychrodurus]|uniref:hypothetical protein n=1 Tax=Pedobacter psychrodurus TaxID=2530456 RepID=UPI00292E18C6|nr:hypothetical protein [Pedobacter psychrodurus]
MVLDKFSEVLNDAINYFILGDIQLLSAYKTDLGLPDDLARELTTSSTGDDIVENGIIIPMVGIENCPYTIIFHSQRSSVELLKDDSQLQVRQDGYVLKVENGTVFLFTWRILENFTDASVAGLIERYRLQHRPLVALENGWYTVEIFGGLTMQEVETRMDNGKIISDKEFEPTLEFVFTAVAEQREFTADINYAFKLTDTGY